MLKGMMMNRPLKIADMLTYAEDVHPNSEIVSSTVEGGIHKATYRQTAARSRRLAKALLANGIKAGDRVATLAWTVSYTHLTLPTKA